jgi:hypothetical protein
MAHDVGTGCTVKLFQDHADYAGERPFSMDEKHGKYAHVGLYVYVSDPILSLQCRAPYISNWTRGLDGRCPNLIPTEEERALYGNITTFQVKQTFQTREKVYDDHFAMYESLARFWSDWNGWYVSNATFPRLVVRFEDTLFNLEKVMKLISECVGIPMDGPFEYHLDKAKHNKQSADFVTGKCMRACSCIA